MLARLFVGLIKDDLISNNDIIFQTDADLIPINKKYYQSFDKSDSIKILDVSSFQSPIGKFRYKMKSYQMYFMGHIGMKQSINYYKIYENFLFRYEKMAMERNNAF